jgi:hypothetical protein
MEEKEKEEANQSTPYPLDLEIDELKGLGILPTLSKGIAKTPRPTLRNQTIINYCLSTT